jgi:hypothetical protein
MIIHSDRIARRAEQSGLDYRGLARQSAVAWVINAFALSLSSMLFIGVAAAQSSYGPIVDGRRPQPTPQQIESKHDKDISAWQRWHERVKPDVIRLYDEITRGPRGR